VSPLIDKNLPEPYLSFLRGNSYFDNFNSKNSNSFIITMCPESITFLSVLLNINSEYGNVSFLLGNNCIEMTCPSRPSAENLKDLEQNILGTHEFFSKEMRKPNTLASDECPPQELWPRMVAFLKSDRIIPISESFPVNFELRKKIFGAYSKDPYFSIILSLFCHQLQHQLTTVSELRHKLDEPQSTISRKLDDLEARGLLERVLCDRDRRVVRVKLLLAPFLKCLKYLTLIDQTYLISNRK
jgi:DNA-binding transcriptional ArsR family regulator